VNISIDQEYLIGTLVELVQMNSINPSLVAAAPGEAEIGAYVAELMRELGLAVTVTEIEPGRVNVVGKLAGRGGGQSLLLNAHMDTVGVAGMTLDPFSAAVQNGRLYGRGSQDMKASLAAMLAAVKALVDGGVTLAGDLWLTAVADEEAYSIGTAKLVEQIVASGEKIDAAIVTEPTDLALCLAHRGFIWYEVVTEGRAAHGSRYQEGVDANMRMGRFLAELDKLEQALRGREPHPLAGPPSLHAALLNGGTELSTYAAKCVLQLERRTIPGETEAQATAELQAIIDQLAAADETFKGTVKPFFQRDPFAITAVAPIVQLLQQITTTHLGQPPAHMGGTFWTDAALFAEVGIDTVLIGPKGQGLHSAEEWVDLQSAVDLAAILVETAVQFCSRVH
jgi:acetylornithine deacetylase